MIDWNAVHSEYGQACARAFAAARALETVECEYRVALAARDEIGRRVLDMMMTQAPSK